MDVSIIIVSYNTENLTRNCLKSIFEQTKDIDFEVIVVDNASHDGSVQMIKTEFPEVKVIENDKNPGFGGANNLGLKIAQGKYVFYLNSDTIVLNNAVKMFFDYFENDKTNTVGALGCNLINENHEVVSSYYEEYMPLRKRCATFFRTWLGTNYRTLKYFFTHKKEEIKQVEVKKEYFIGEVTTIIGADLFVRNNELAKFDERFFMYYEEEDLQLQLHKVGLKSFLIEGPQIIHLEGGSTEKPVSSKVFVWGSKKRIWTWISCYRLYEKNTSGFGQRVLLFIMKILITSIWLNPLIAKTTAKYIKYLTKPNIKFTETDS